MIILFYYSVKLLREAFDWFLSKKYSVIYGRACPSFTKCFSAHFHLLAFMLRKCCHLCKSFAYDCISAVDIRCGCLFYFFILLFYCCSVIMSEIKYAWVPSRVLFLIYVLFINISSGILLCTHILASFCCLILLDGIYDEWVHFGFLFSICPIYRLPVDITYGNLLDSVICVLSACIVTYLFSLGIHQ